MNLAELYIDLFHLLISDSLAGLIFSWLEFGFYPETGPRARPPDEVDDGFVTHQGLPPPVHTDERKHSVLDLVPFAGSRRVMAHRDTKTELIYEALQMVFPCTGAVPIAPTAVCTDQQGLGLGVVMPTHSLPPSPDTLDGKLGSVVGDSNVHEAFVALRITMRLG